jgi:hypothetical protein
MPASPTRDRDIEEAEAIGLIRPDNAGGLSWTLLGLAVLTVILSGLFVWGCSFLDRANIDVAPDPKTLTSSSTSVIGGP